MEGEVAKYGTVDQGNKVVQEKHHIEIKCSDKEWGEIAGLEIERMIRGKPLHRRNLGALLEKYSNPEELGRLVRSEPIISEVDIDLRSNEKSNEISLMFQNEVTRRGYLNEWINVLKEKYSNLTFKLFTDGQEIIVGTSEDGSKRRLSFKKKPNLSISEIRERLAKLEDLVPKIEIFEDPNKQTFMLEASYIEGRYADQKEIEEFKKKLAEKGIDPNKFDLNPGNLIVDPNGRIYLVDMDEIILGF